MSPHQIRMIIESEFLQCLWEMMESREREGGGGKEGGIKAKFVDCILLTVHPTVRLLVLDSRNRTLSGVPISDAATN